MSSIDIPENVLEAAWQCATEGELAIGGYQGEPLMIPSREDILPVLEAAFEELGLREEPWEPHTALDAMGLKSGRIKPSFRYVSKWHRHPVEEDPRT